MKKILTLVAVLASLAACSNEQQAPQTAAKPEAQPAAVEQQVEQAVPAAAFQKDVVVSTQDFTAPNVTLSITPNPYNRCEHPKGNVALSIEYDAGLAGAKHTQLWFQRSNGKQVLWGQAPGRLPARMTKDWGHEGMKVLLVDVDSSNLLAVQTIHADDCK